MRNAVDRAGRFLSLASLVSVLLCAIAVAMAARRYVHRHLDTVALLKTLGATRAFHPRASRCCSCSSLALLAAVAGAALGFLAQEWLLRTIRGLLAVTELPAAESCARWRSASSPRSRCWRDLRCRRCCSWRACRRCACCAATSGRRRPWCCSPSVPPWPVVLLLIYWVVREPKLFLYFTAGLAAFVLVLTLAGLLLVYLAGRLRGRVGVAWRFGVANLSRRRAESVVQLVAFGTGIMVLLLLGILRGDLNGDWQRTLPPNLPNYFFVNIPPGAACGVRAVPRDAQGARTTKVLPIIRGRLTSINGKPVEDPKTGRAQRRELRDPRAEPHLVGRARAPTTASSPAAGGQPQDTGKPLVSLASEFQESLGVKVGRPAHLRHRRRGPAGDRRQHPQGEMGHLPAELLHRVRARGAREGAPAPT